MKGNYNKDKTCLYRESISIATSLSSSGARPRAVSSAWKDKRVHFLQEKKQEGEVGPFGGISVCGRDAKKVAGRTKFRSASSLPLPKVSVERSPSWRRRGGRRREKLEKEAHEISHLLSSTCLRPEILQRIRRYQRGPRVGIHIQR